MSAREIPVSRGCDDHGWILRPCPECRQFYSQPVYDRTNLYESGSNSVYMSLVKIVCPECRYEISYHTSAKDAAKAWNYEYDKRLAKENMVVTDGC